MIPAELRILVCTEPLDMRLGFDRLAAAVREKLVSVIAITDGTVITLGDGGAFPVSVSPDALERAGNGNGKRIM